VFVLLRVFRTGSLAVHSPVVRVLGWILFVSGLGLAVWARIYLGRNWGMPMTKKDEPELVTSGPYRFVRHPIYFGLLLALLGTAMATNLYWLIALGVMGAYFVHAAAVEERLMTTSSPATYPGYRARTEMLIPFVLRDTRARDSHVVRRHPELGNARRLGRRHEEAGCRDHQDPARR